MAETMGCRWKSRASFQLFLNGLLNPWYVCVKIGVDANVPSHEVSNFNSLELAFANDSSYSHLLPEMRGEGGREKKIKFKTMLVFIAFLCLYDN